MNIIVTGAGGFLGVPLSARLAELGHSVTAIGRHEKPKSLEQVQKLNWLQLDLLKDDLPPEVLEAADVVFHLASLLTPEPGCVDEASYFLQNEQVDTRVFSQAAKKGKRFVYASTQMIYGDVNQLNIDEKCWTSPKMTAYGVSKRNGENWLAWQQGKSGGSVAVLRLTGFIESPASVVASFIKSALENLPIEVRSRGEVCRDYLTISAAVDAFVGAATAELPEAVTSYNIGSGCVMTTAKMARLICQIVGSQSEVILSDRPAPRGHFVYNVEKARRELGFVPPDLESEIVHFAKSKL